MNCEYIYYLTFFTIYVNDHQCRFNLNTGVYIVFLILIFSLLVPLLGSPSQKDMGSCVASAELCVWSVGGVVAERDETLTSQT